LALQDQNEARVAKLNDMHVELQLLRSTLPRAATALAPPLLAAEGVPASEPPPDEAWALDALLRGLVAEAETVRARQASLVARSVHDLEHHRKGDAEALLAQEVACTIRQVHAVAPPPPPPRSARPRRASCQSAREKRT
jgi:hypothetical protein